MALNQSSVLVDGTVATTGGTATSFASRGNTLTQHDLFLDDASNIIDQTTLEASVKLPKVSVSAPNGYTQSRNTMYLRIPLALDNGNSTVNTVRIEIATDVETTAAEKLSLRVLTAQLLHDSDFLQFWDDSSVE